jgi:predicted porin
MVEKGILSHFVQRTYYDNIDNHMKTITSNEKIKGLQWSLGISPGVDYHIHKNYSFYFEPKLSYYFDNNQPKSARTIHPLVVGINAGVRYVW